ncbi:MAG: hypothetical protein CSA33_01270 [Desulfobulbus propionicus]|nr:MAG: hypothetical protein CSA33_01270 [Desulfobulbus propionicus]
MKNSIQFGLVILTCSLLLLTGYTIDLRESTLPAQKDTVFRYDQRTNDIVSVHCKDNWTIALSAERGGRASTDTGIRSPLIGLFILGCWLLFPKYKVNRSLFPATTEARRYPPVTTDTITYQDVAEIAKDKFDFQERVRFLNNPERLGHEFLRMFSCRVLWNPESPCLPKPLHAKRMRLFFT